MSSDLIWGLTRSNSSFMIKRNGIILSKEPGNLMNKHSFKYSGLAPSRTICITSGQKGIILTQKTKNSNKPCKSVAKTTIYKPARTTAKKVKNIVKGYRPDLAKVLIIIILIQGCNCSCRSYSKVSIASQT